jgi:hypothetical protein
MHRSWLGGLLALLGALPAAAQALPGAYFRLIETGLARVDQRLNAEPGADLKTLESRGNWRHFPYALMAPAVLYAKQHPQNPRYRDPKMLASAIRIGDLLAAESEKGTFEPRLDSDWDTYIWLEAWRLLERDLGPERSARWKREIIKNIATLEEGARERLDFPWYNSPYIGTSPNHYALWAANLYLGGRWLGNPEWEKLGARILHRYAAEEQTEDGYWGEHSRNGPTTGYNHLTLSAVALYGEYSGDPAAAAALRRATDFHKNFTFLDGTPADVINDRNRHWGVSPWSHFAFSWFADGRRYAEFLTGFFKGEDLSMEALGRLSQDALYYREGPSEAIPQDQERAAYRMRIPAGMRKSGPWQVFLSGIVDTPAVNNQFYLDRQGHISIFHRRLGLIVTGANSKRQPELATFSEKLLGQVFHMPLSSRLQMTDGGDRLSLAYNTFFSDLYLPPPAEGELKLRFVISGKGTPPEDPRLTLQLCLKPGEPLETGAGGKLGVGSERIELDAAALGGLIRHHGWTLKTDATARLAWPIYPHSPYANAPETSLQYAVAALSVPLTLKPVRGKYVRPQEQEISFTLSAP